MYDAGRLGSPAFGDPAPACPGSQHQGLSAKGRAKRCLNLLHARCWTALQPSILLTMRLPAPAGVFEAGCFPGCWYSLSVFFTSLEVGIVPLMLLWFRRG